MRHAEECEGPFEMALHGGEVLAVAALDGGGAYVGEHPLTGEPGHQCYEVHGYYADGEFLCVQQSQVEKVTVTATGEEVEFGNPYFPGHPRFAGFAS